MWLDSSGYVEICRDLSGCVAGGAGLQGGPALSATHRGKKTKLDGRHCRRDEGPQQNDTHHTPNNNAGATGNGRRPVRRASHITASPSLRMELLLRSSSSTHSVGLCCTAASSATVPPRLPTPSCRPPAKKKQMAERDTYAQPYPPPPGVGRGQSLELRAWSLT